MNQFKDKEMIKPFINCFRRFFGKIRHYESGINYIEKAFQCGNNQDYVGAINYVNQFIEINPDNAEAYYIRGLSRVMLYEFDESLNDFSKAISLKKRYPEALLERGKVYCLIADFEKGINDFSEAIRYNPSLGEAYSCRGYAYNDIGMPEKGYEDLIKAERLS